MSCELDDKFYMRRALELATLGMGYVSPNPLVGCVIVHENRIIGEGWHRMYGEAHAEVNAINSVQDKNELQDSTVYVSLEPCAHHGKTPPCADLLVSSKVKKVVICNEDPNPKVAGKGIGKLVSAGIEVAVGILKEEGGRLNSRFFCNIKNSRPYIILKWAQTADGFIAREDFDSKWISNEYSRQLVHKWRAEEDAILVGKNTAKFDNPELNVRNWTGPDPLRVVIDPKLELDKNLKLFDGTIPTICYHTKSQDSNDSVFVGLREEGFIEAILADLYEKAVGSLIVEGGSATLQNFIKNNLWDEARVFISDQTFEKGIMAPKVEGLAYQEIIQGDKLFVYKNKSDQWQKNS